MQCYLATKGCINSKQIESLHAFHVTGLDAGHIIIYVTIRGFLEIYLKSKGSKILCSLDRQFIIFIIFIYCLIVVYLKKSGTLLIFSYHFQNASFARK